MANMTDVSTNEPKVFSRCQQEFINRHVRICSRLSIHPSLSACPCITVAVCCHSVKWLWAEMAAEASICKASTLGRGFRIIVTSFSDIMLNSHPTLLFCTLKVRFFFDLAGNFLHICRKHASTYESVFLFKSYLTKLWNTLKQRVWHFGKSAYYKLQPGLIKFNQSRQKHVKEWVLMVLVSLLFSPLDKTIILTLFYGKPAFIYFIRSLFLKIWSFSFKKTSWFQTLHSKTEIKFSVWVVGHTHVTFT